MNWHLAQLADFGLARLAPGCKEELTAETGSYRWMAPEVIRHKSYDEKCDVYSFAMLCWEMLTYRMPFDKMHALQARRFCQSQAQDECSVIIDEQNAWQRLRDV